MFEGPLDESILKRAREKGLVQIRVHNLREFTHDKHHVVDDKPYGGGPGMLMKPEPIFEAVEKLQRADSCVVLMTPQGTPFTQKRAQEFAEKPHLIVICGHYEGVDERVRETLVDEEVSIGDYVSDERRAGRGGGCGCRRAAVARCVGRRAKRGRRFVRQRFAGGAAVHAPARVSRDARAGRVAVGRSRGDCEVAR